MSYKKELDKITWSFSTLNLYNECPYAFYLKKIEREDEEENFFAENGTAMHEVLADVLTGDLSLEDAPGAYSDKFDLICSETTQSTMDKTFENCANYLCEVQSLPEQCEILGVEMGLKFKIDKYNFVGFADAVIRDKQSGEVWLIDHKSSPHFFKKDGTPLKAQQDNYYSYKKQMYLYCLGLREQFGINVDNICWHHFRDGGALTVIPFREEELEETKAWAIDTIERIYQDKEFEAQKSFMRCQRLCGYRNDCDYLLTDDEEEEEEA